MRFVVAIVAVVDVVVYSNPDFPSFLWSSIVLYGSPHNVALFGRYVPNMIV